MKTLRELSRDVRCCFGAFVMLLFVGVSLLTFFAPHDPGVWLAVPRSLPPSWEHLFGTTTLGQDVFWQMAFSIRNSLLVAFSASVMSRIISITLGLMAGFVGGITDRVITLIGEVWSVIPLIFVLMLLSMMMGRLDVIAQILLFGILGWGLDLRLIRAQILTLREREFTYTAILSGTPAIKLIFTEYLPFILPLVFSTFIFNVAMVLGMEIGLAFIGLTDLTVPTIGAMIETSRAGQALFLGMWWWKVTPIIVALLLFTALYLVAASVSEYLDPRARIQRVGAIRT